MRFIVTIDPEFVRDMQLLVGSEADPGTDGNWLDWNGGKAAVYCGMYSGTRDTVLELAARENGVSQSLLTLVPLDDADGGFVPSMPSEGEIPVRDDASIETLKTAIFLSGPGEVSGFLGYDPPAGEDKDVLDARLGQAIEAMSDADFAVAWRKYVLPED